MLEYKKLIPVIALILSMTSCGDRAIVSDLLDNNLKVVLKGTYSSSSVVEPSEFTRTASLYS